MASLRNIFRLTSRSLRFASLHDSYKTHTKQFSSGAYDPDGKTVLNILNNEENAPLMIDGYSVLGFRLNTGFFVLGPIAIFPNSILSWNVEGDHDINERSLSLFLNLSPKLDVFLIGLSNPNDLKLITDVRNQVQKMLTSKKYERVNVEVLPTEKAVTTFNFLNSESRFVGAALLPPIGYSRTKDDEFRSEYLSKKKESMDIFLDKT